MKAAIRYLIAAGQPWPWSVPVVVFAVCHMQLTRPALDASWLVYAQWLLTHLALTCSLPLYARIMPRFARRFAIFGTAFFCADTLSRVLWLVNAYGVAALAHLALR